MDSPNDAVCPDVSILGPTLRFKGELVADEDLLIRGHVHGSIKHSKRLTIGSDGHIKADIDGHIVAVAGTVEGDVRAQTSVAVTETGRLTGDVSAPSVSIVDGADVNGNVIMDASKRKR
ncbi:MAG TPA: polymer-forming cytoskeletal protein [Steroidobacteraceae bacterium]|nr:polymer-forming cytoskeletal protein [Steroidobacteraceae bacterium]